MFANEHLPPRLAAMNPLPLACGNPLADVPREAAKLSHIVWREIRPRPGLGGFKPSEFNYPEQMDVAWLRLLWLMRQLAGVPFRPVSDHRTPKRNADAHAAKKSTHLEAPCRSIDLRVKNNYERFRILAAARHVGIVRVGIYGTRKDGTGSLHLDASERNPQEMAWTRW